MPRESIGARLKTAAAAVVALSVSLAGGCASTEFFNEGPGQPSDRASGAVPPGSLGVCKEPLSKRPPIVNPALWDHAKVCNGRTPSNIIHLGYGRMGTGADQAADLEMSRALDMLQKAPKPDSGNVDFVALMRKLRERAIRDPELQFRVSQATARTTVCDYTYMLNTMERERTALEGGDKCAAEAYDPKVRAEACVFDTTVPEAVWLTSAWDCVTNTGAVGQEQSCHRLCAYDDYCAMQVSCAAGDLDLLLCVMGVCLPEARAGF